MILKAFSDGGCSNNGGYIKDLPSKGKFGYVIIEDDKILYEFAASDTKEPTNNRMEIKGIIFLMNRLSYIDIIS